MRFFKEILNVDEYLNHEEKLEDRIEYLEDVVKNLEEPFILYFGGIPEITISQKLNEGVYGIEDFLLSLSGAKEEDSFIYKVRSIADEDEEWTKARNQELTSVFYRKFILKKDVQKIAADRLKEVIAEMKKIKDKLEQKKKAEKEEKEEFKSLYRMGEVHHKQSPSKKQDGLIDLDIICNKTGDTVRFIYRDVFDFGVYCHPEKYNGEKEVFYKEGWTDKEKEMSDWLIEFGEFGRHVRM